MRASWTASAALAISISFRTAASGSLNGLGSANFTGFVLGGDVGDVDQVFLQAVTVEDVAARAFQIDAAWLPGLPFVRRQPLPRVPQGVLPRGPIPLITPRLEISLGSLCQKHFPRGFRNRNAPGRTWQRCRFGVRLDASLDKSRSTTATDPHHG